MELSMVKFVGLISLSTAAVFVFGPITGAVAYSGEKLAKNAKINLTEATAIALKARPGKVTDRELEQEQGGSGLRYSFDVRSKGITYEVGVDAQTGAVLENGADGSHPD